MTGYPAAGTHNVTACVGNRVYPYACYNTTAFAQRIEEAIFPNDLHFKIALTGKRNPRLGEDFIKWADEDSIVKIILNAYQYVGKYIDPNAPGGKEHVGYIVDRTGFEEFKRWILDGVTLPAMAEVCTPMYWKGAHFG